MTPPKYWPQHAEDARMDAIALLLVFHPLQLSLEAAILRDDKLEALRLNLAIDKKWRRAVRLLKAAKLGERVEIGD
jgi:hypothetical protein